MPDITQDVSQLLFDYLNGLITAEEAGPEIVALAAAYNPILGTAADDDLIGTKLADIAFGDTGQDRIVGGAGEDLFFGGAGRDRLYGGGSDDFLFGGDDTDRLFGGSGNDWLAGDLGNDQLRGGRGQDVLFGGIGRDRLWGDRDDDQLFGGSGRDRLYGGDGDDEMYGGNGHDSLYGGNGVDFLSGENGNDRLYGGADNDRLNGEAGIDSLYGGDGDDELTSISGINHLWGGAGSDTFHATDGEAIIYDFEGGVDALILNGDDISGSVLSADRNHLTDSNGVNIATVTLDGDDVLLNYGTTSALIKNVTLADLGVDEDQNINAVLGTDGDDTIYGSTGLTSANIFGLAGNDDIFAGRNDIVTGGAGRDTFFGNSEVTVTDFEVGVDRLGFRSDNSSTSGWVTTDLSDFILYASGEVATGDGESFGYLQQTDAGVEFQQYLNGSTVLLEGLTISDLSGAFSGTQTETLYGSDERDVFNFDMDQNEVNTVRVVGYNPNDVIQFVGDAAGEWGFIFGNPYREDTTIGNGDLLALDEYSYFNEPDYPWYTITLLDVEVVGSDTHISRGSDLMILEDYVGEVPELNFTLYFETDQLFY